MIRYSLFCLFALLIWGCDSSGKKSNEYLPRSTGKSGDMLIIMDSVQWKGELGKEVRKIFASEVPGLPQGEPMFNLIWVHPDNKIRLLTQIRNLVYVFTLDQKTQGSKVLRRNFTPETLEKIKSDTSFYFATRQEEFSKGQEVMYLFSKTEKQLLEHLQEKNQIILDYFNNAERKRLAAELFKTKSTAGVGAFLREDLGIDIRLPIGYKLADKQKDFVWLRYMDAATDKDVFISWKPYTSEYQMLPDSLIEWRNEIAKKYLFEDPDKPNTYLVTEEADAPVYARQIDFKKHYGMELRGLWRTNTRSMGGPFVSLSIIDESKNLIYYIEGFAYAPGRDKREMIRELETILWTFSMNNEVKK